MKKGTLLWKALLFERRLPWRYKKRFSKLKFALFFAPHNFYVKIKFLIKKPKYKIVISSNFFGGVGGVERRLKSIIDSMPQNEFYILASRIINKGFIPSAVNYYLNRPLNKNKKYDIYLYFKSGTPSYIGDKYNFRKKIIVTNGNNVVKDEKSFDYIFLDGKNAKIFCKDYSKCKIALPDITITYPKKTQAIKNLPKRFLLTVFNPYGELGGIKGTDILYKVARYSKLPIVWCYNNATFGNFENIVQLDNIIQLPNISQKELYYLYSKAEAYICFSRSESFGWAIADAFMFNLPIISRDIGIVTLINDQKGVHIYKNSEELKRYLNQTGFIKLNYDKSVLDKFSYKKQINEVLSKDANKRFQTNI